MGVVSEVLGNHGAVHTVVWNGKTYRFRLIDQNVKSAFEKARLAKAKEALALMRDIMSPAEYSVRLDMKIRQYQDGEFEIFSDDGLDFIKTTAGMRLLLSLLTDCDENELMGLLLTKQQEIVALFHLIIRESFPGLGIQTPGQEEASSSEGELPPESASAPPNRTDPNAQTPAA